MKNLDEAIRVATEVVQEFGEDHVAPGASGKPDAISSCMYVMNGQPSCLVGQVLFRTGTSLERLMEEDRANTDGYGDGADHLARRLGWDDDAAAYLLALQRLQDGGATWGEALREAPARAAAESDAY